MHTYPNKPTCDGCGDNHMLRVCYRNCGLGWYMRMVLRPPKGQPRARRYFARQAWDTVMHGTGIAA